jgi:hypothetical protein
MFEQSDKTATVTNHVQIHSHRERGVPFVPASTKFAISLGDPYKLNDVNVVEGAVQWPANGVGLMFHISLSECSCLKWDRVCE